MRTLNEFEKNIIQRIVTQHHRDIVTLLDPYMINKDMVLDYNARTATIHFDQAVYLPNNNVGANHLLDEVLNISDIIISIVGLLDYLKQNNYLKLIQSGQNPNPPRFGRLIQGNIPIQYQIYDEEIVELLLKNAFKTVIVEQPLIELVNDNFISKEDIRHNENISWAKKAFIAAIIIGVFDLLVSSVDTYYDGAAYYSPTTIDSTQFNQIKRQIQFSNSCDQIDNSINLNIINGSTKDTCSIKPKRRRMPCP